MAEPLIGPPEPFRTGTFSFERGKWSSIMVDEPIIYRYQPPTTETNLRETIRFAQDRIPNNDDEAFSSLNGDCFLNAPGRWWIKPGTTASGIAQFVTFPPNLATFADYGRAGASFPIQQTRAVVTPTQTAVKIAAANARRKWILIQNFAGNGSIYLRIGSNAFTGGAGTQNGVQLTGGASLILSGDLLSLDDIWAYAPTGTPDIVVIEMGN